MPKKATLTPVIKVDQSKCVGCYSCIETCPVKFCMDASGDTVHLNHDLCIGCGQCLIACKHQARTIRDDRDAFFDGLKLQEKMVAIVAPAVAANFPGEYLNLNGYLQSLGVEAIFDVSFGAELTIYSYMKYMEEHKPEMIISQPCPAIVTFLEVYHPELLPFLAPADSPMAHTMRMIREYYPQYARHKIVVISPCIAKRREFDELGIGDYNVTFASLKKYITEINIKIADFPQVDYANPPAERAVSFSTPGGLMATANRDKPGIWQRTRKIEGTNVVYTYLRHMSQHLGEGKLKNQTVFMIDCLNCDMGCNGGPGTGENMVAPQNVLEYPVQKRRKEQEAFYGTGKAPLPPEKQRASVQKVLEQYWKPDLYKRTYVDRSANYRIKIPTSVELAEVYRSMGKYSERDIYDCCACGFGNCMDMAIAVFNGLNQPRNCHHYDLFLIKQQEAAVHNLNIEVQEERDEITAMKDSLHVGIFLMNEAYHIRPNYSATLENIMEVTGLAHVSFLDLLADSVNNKDMDTLKDYYEMVRNESFDREMLADINPLREFTYNVPNSDRKKILRGTFSRVHHGENRIYLLGTLMDITEEKQLEMELLEADKKRQAEMRSLFDTLQVDPGVLEEFLDDTTYEFDRINSIMRSKTHDNHQAVTEIYQAVHATKSNAAILGLQQFAEKLHELENILRELRAMEHQITFELLLKFSVEFELIMRERDKIKATMARLQSFKSKGTNQSGRILTQVLQHACERVAISEAKKIEFNFDRVEEKAVESGARRLMKDVLVQLARNAVFHGIEHPQERVQAGKPETGRITLAVQFDKTDSKKIIITLSDDGKGLDFDKIREKALGQKLLTEEEANNKDKLLSMIFEAGFSTSDTENLHAGRGVGMSLVRQRIHEGNGSIEIKTEKGKGSKFIVHLPIVHEAVESAEEDGGKGAKESKKSGKTGPVAAAPEKAPISVEAVPEKIPVATPPTEAAGVPA